MHQSHLSIHITSHERNSQDSSSSSLRPSTMPLCSHTLNFPSFHLSFPLFLPSLWCPTANLLTLFPLFHTLRSVAMSPLLPGFHPSLLPPDVCVGSGPYSCINGTSGFKPHCATCHSSVSASHHCQSIPLTLFRSLSQGPANRLSSAYSQQQSCQCF